MTALTIRAARLPEEADELADIWLAAVRATHTFLETEQIDSYYPRVRDDFLPILTLAVAVDATDRPIGFLGSIDHRIEALFVDPAWHGQGAGSALIDHAMHAYESIDVDVNEQNPSAVAFYMAVGFEQIGRSPVDSDGAPFPLLHLRRRTATA